MNSEAAVAAIVADLRGRMPALAELPAEMTGMGPEVTLPVVHMHLLLEHIRFLQAQTTLTAGELTIARGTSVGLPPDRTTDHGRGEGLAWSDDDQAAYAGRIGNVVAFGQAPLDAATVLFQAACAILIVNFPAAAAGNIVRGIAADLAEKMPRMRLPISRTTASGVPVTRLGS